MGSDSIRCSVSVCFDSSFCMCCTNAPDQGNMIFDCPVSVRFVVLNSWCDHTFQEVSSICINHKRIKIFINIDDTIFFCVCFMVLHSCGPPIYATSWYCRRDSKIFVFCNDLVMTLTLQSFGMQKGTHPLMTGGKQGWSYCLTSCPSSSMFGVDF